MSNKISFDAASFGKVIQGVWNLGDMLGVDSVLYAYSTLDELFLAEDLQACYFREELAFLMHVAEYRFED